MEYRKLDDLEKLEGNPRIIKDKEFKTLCDSIRDNPEYFEARPLILSDRTGDLVIIAGNQRYEAAKVVGLQEVPTFLIAGLTEAKEREIVIRDNVSNGEFDFELLANEWGDLPLIDWGVKINSFEPDDPNAEWEGMPEFENEDKTAFRTIHVHFATQVHVDEFSKVMGQAITEKTRFIWHPEAVIEKQQDKKYE